MISITKEHQFLDVVHSTNQISIVYVGRDGCGGCTTFQPIIEEYVQNHIHDVHTIPVAYYYLNTMQDFVRPYLGAKNLPTNGVPSMVIYYGGTVYASQVGTMDMETLQAFCTDNINKILQSLTTTV